MHLDLSSLSVKVFADGADLAEMAALASDPLIRGFTTNPTLMRRAGVTSYHAFARQVLAVIPDLPVSFEVLSDDVDRMAEEARVIGGWGDNVYVKVPITNTSGASTLRIVEELNCDRREAQRDRHHHPGAGLRRGPPPHLRHPGHRVRLRRPDRRHRAGPGPDDGRGGGRR